MISLWAAFGLLAIGLTIVLFKYILLKKDIRQIGCKLEEITSADTNSNLCTSTFDVDITVLTQHINKMLKKSRKDYQDTKRMEADLKRAVTNISHDLRTPLTSAIGYIQMIETSELDAETVSRYHAIIHDRLDALKILMDSLFAFSSAIEGDITLQPVNVCNILRDTIAGSFAELDSNGFVVEIDIPDTPVYFICDEDALKRVIQNLVSNAIFHGRSCLHVQLHDGIIEIANRANELNLIDTVDIFERFHTADASRTKKRTGLGLAIAKELIEKMGGSISAKIDGDMLTMCIHLVMA